MKKTLLLIALSSLFFVACADNSDDNSATPSSSNSSSEVANSSSDSSSAATSGLAGLAVSTDDAIKLYQETYGDSDITSIDLEMSLGTPVYKIEGRDDTKEYEVNINAENEEIVSQKEENLDNEDQGATERSNDALDLDGIISVDEAASIAEGAATGSAEEFSLDKDFGTTYWEVKVVNGSSESDIKINAKTSEILEQENDDD